MKFQSIKTSNLKNKQIYQILKLKNSKWKFGYKSQQSWFKKNAKMNDIHNIMINKNNIIGYTFLAFRTLEYYKNSKKNKKSKYILFSTLILNSRYRNFLHASKMMRFNSSIILKLKKPSFLLCQDNKIKFYQFFGWFKFKKKSFQVPDHRNTYSGLVYNFEKFKKLINYKYNFYYNL